MYRDCSEFKRKRRTRRGDGSGKNKNAGKRDSANDSPLTSDDLHLWASWLIKIAETAESEWHEWLYSYINFGHNLQKSLIKALNPNNLPLDCLQESDLTDGLPTGDTISFDLACQSEDLNDEEEIIALPHCPAEMVDIVHKFNEGARKYYCLHQKWVENASKVNEDIEGKTVTPEEELNMQERIPNFLYLKEKKNIDIGIAVEKGIFSQTGRERISCKNKNLFFNIRNPE